jgi:hypothetical protein
MGRMPGRDGSKQRQSSRRTHRRQELVFAPPPVPLKRPPRTELKARVDLLDRRAFGAIDAVVGRLGQAMEQSTSLDEIRLLSTRSQMLLAMKASHRSVRRLVGRGEDRQDLELSLDALPVVRVQLERCFVALLIDDNPARWHTRYRRNAWKAFAEKFFRDQRLLGHFEPYGPYFGPNGTGVGLLRDFAREMDVSEDALQTLRVQVLGEPPDPRFKTWFIADMPTPGRCAQELTDPVHRNLAALLYAYYNNLSHFSHGGLFGLMQAAILRQGAPDSQTDVEKRRFWSQNVLGQILPLSYVGMLLAATLFARPFLAESPVREALLRAWRPHHSDGSPLGVALWDAWAGEALGTEAADEPFGERADRAE